MDEEIQWLEITVGRSWYENKVGEKYEIHNEYDGKYSVKRPEHSGTGYSLMGWRVAYEDCKLVSPLKEGEQE